MLEFINTDHRDIRVNDEIPEALCALVEYCRDHPLTRSRVPESFSDIDFWNRIAIADPENHSELFDAIPAPASIVFSSGGTSGPSRLTWLSFEEVLGNCKFHGFGYQQCGIRADDRVATFGHPGLMNSEFTVYFGLKETGCLVLPIGECESPKELVDLIRKLDATVLLVMPSDLIPLVKYLESTSQTLANIRLVVTGGEALLNVDRFRFQKVLSIATAFRSVFQTSDTGTIGYQCDKCDDGVYHIHNSLQYVEIVEVDSTGVGQLVVSNFIRRLTPVLRLRTGDRASKVNGVCDCGSKAPRIRLHGRVGSIVKVGGEKFDMNCFNAAKNSAMVCTNDFVVYLSKDPAGRDCFSIYSSTLMNDSILRQSFIAQIYLLNPLFSKKIEQGIVAPISFLPFSESEIVVGKSGKIRWWIDNRFEIRLGVRPGCRSADAPLQCVDSIHQ